MLDDSVPVDVESESCRERAENASQVEQKKPAEVQKSTERQSFIIVIPYSPSIHHPSSIIHSPIHGEHRSFIDMDVMP